MCHIRKQFVWHLDNHDGDLLKKQLYYSCMQPIMWKCPYTYMYKQVSNQTYIAIRPCFKPDRSREINKF